MLPASPAWRRVAAVVSTLGHPLVTGSGFTLFLVGQRLRGAAAWWVAGSMLALVVVPISLWNLRQMRRGAYTNFDVSERAHRHSFYPVLLGLLGVAAGALWRQGMAVPLAFRYGLLAVWALLLVCYLLNFWLKVSLHAALSFFLAYVLGQLYPEWGWLAGMAAVLVAASRLVLGRHALPELVAGAALGVAAAHALAWVLTPATG